MCVRVLCEVELYACAGPDTRWVLAALADFPTACGGWTNLTTDDAPVVAGSCVANTHGPPCSSDAQCDAFSGCVRCASSGYCTDVPL
jgi:hypothetical protein